MCAGVLIWMWTPHTPSSMDQRTLFLGSQSKCTRRTRETGKKLGRQIHIMVYKGHLSKGLFQYVKGHVIADALAVFLLQDINWCSRGWISVGHVQFPLSAGFGVPLHFSAAIPVQCNSVRQHGQQQCERQRDRRKITPMVWCLDFKLRNWWIRCGETDFWIKASRIQNTNFGSPCTSIVTKSIPNEHVTF